MHAHTMAAAADFLAPLYTCEMFATVCICTHLPRVHMIYARCGKSRSYHMSSAPTYTKQTRARYKTVVNGADASRCVDRESSPAELSEGRRCISESERPRGVYILHLVSRLSSSCMHWRG